MGSERHRQSRHPLSEVRCRAYSPAMSRHTIFPLSGGPDVQTSCNLALCGTKRSVEIRRRDDQLGLADRYYLRGRRVGAPCPWSHCAIRTLADLGAHKRRADPRSEAWAKSWPPVIAARNSFSPSRSRQRWKIRLSGHQAAWYRQINSLQGHHKRDAVILVPPSFLLSVNLRTKLLIGVRGSNLHIWVRQAN